MSVCIRMYVYTYIHTHTYTHMYVYIYTHTHILNIPHLVVVTLVDICPLTLPACMFLTLGNSIPVSVLVPPLTKAAHVLQG